MTKYYVAWFIPLSIVTEQIDFYRTRSQLSTDFDNMKQRLHTACVLLFVYSLNPMHDWDPSSLISPLFKRGNKLYFIASGLISECRNRNDNLYVLHVVHLIYFVYKYSLLLSRGILVEENHACSITIRPGMGAGRFSIVVLHMLLRY